MRLNKKETLHSHSFHYTKKKFSIQVFFSKCDQIHRKLQICTRLKSDSKCITNTMKITALNVTSYSDIFQISFTNKSSAAVIFCNNDILCSGLLPSTK